jgi:hypothetical protein
MEQVAGAMSTSPGTVASQCRTALTTLRGNPAVRTMPVDLASCL